MRMGIELMRNFFAVRLPITQLLILSRSSPLLKALSLPSLHVVQSFQLAIPDSPPHKNQLCGED